MLFNPILFMSRFIPFELIAMALLVVVELKKFIASTPLDIKDDVGSGSDASDAGNGIASAADVIGVEEVDADELISMLLLPRLLLEVVGELSSSGKSISPTEDAEELPLSIMDESVMRFIPL